MWKTWKTSASRRSIFAVNTDFGRKWVELRTLSTAAGVEKLPNVENCKVCTILHKDRFRQKTEARSEGFFRRFFFAPEFVVFATRRRKEGDFGVRERRFPNPAGDQKSRSGPSGLRGAEIGRGRGREKRLRGGTSDQGSVKVSRSTSVWVLFFISRREARRVSSSLSPRIRV